MTTASSSLRKFTYRPEIDGLRTLAVLPVLLFHAGLGFPGGFMGVDIFFVISGYLISSIILRDLSQDSFRFRDFWERRIRRILPAAAAMTIVTLIVGGIILLPESFENLGQSALAQILMVANFYFWQQDGYFAAPSDYEPLLHTWSLAVEEQFYLILPFLLVFLYARGHRWMKGVIFILFLASLIWSFFGPYLYPMATFYLLPARAWELLLGVIIALYPIQIPGGKFGATTASLAGLIMMIYPMLTYTPDIPFPGVSAVPPCLGAALFILGTRDHQTFSKQLFSIRPFVFIGKISYSLYLWHWPILVYGRHLSVHETPLATRLILLGASFVVAILSWRFIETPFRRPGKLLPDQRRTFRFFAVTTLLVGAGATIAYRTEGLPSRFTPEHLALAAVADEDFDAPDNKNLREDGKLPRLQNDFSVTPTILVWGDSHAKAALPVFRDLCEEQETDLYYACKGGIPPILGIARAPLKKEMAQYNNAVLEALKTTGVKTVILIARWSIYPEKSPSFFMPDITYRKPDGSPPEEVFKNQLTKTVRLLREMDLKVWIVKEVPWQLRSVPENLVNAARFGRSFSALGVTVTQHRKRQKFVNGVLNSLVSENVRLIDPLPVLSDGEHHTLVMKDGLPLYTDADHLSIAGSRLLRPLVERIFQEAASPDSP